jgi:UDP-2,3-diacylglucosamine pyrophosphatase LpxH
MSSGDRPMVIFVSDIHLTDTLHGASIPRKDAFERFWVRIQAARGARPAHLCFVGDLFDIVRSPSWFESAYRPYSDPDPNVVALVERIVADIVERERDFFDAIRARVETGELEVHYVLGNHDRLLRFAPRARRAVWKALTGRDEDVELGDELEFPEHGVLAYHGNRADDINYHPEGAGTIGDAIGSELIVRFPRSVRLMTGEEHPELDDVDDVRPVYAVPAWVRQLGVLDRRLMRPVHDTWVQLIETFFSKPFVKGWLREKHQRFHLDTGKKLRLLLELSTKRIVAKGSDKRMTELYRVMQHAFDGKMAQMGARLLAERAASKGLSYVVNGHSHFASMLPLGSVDGRTAVYFNTGTWRAVHQIGHGLGGRPTFLPFDAMSYLVFFPSGDPLGRDYEWWTGAMVARAATS